MPSSKQTRLRANQRRRAWERKIENSTVPIVRPTYALLACFHPACSKLTPSHRCTQYDCGLHVHTYCSLACLVATMDDATAPRCMMS